MRYIIAFLLLSITPCFGQKGPPMFTDGMLNGRFWIAATNEEKTVYVAGVVDALNLVRQHARMADNFTSGDYIKELDKIYNDTENINIPLIWIFDYCTTKLKGETTKTALESNLIALRKLAIPIKLSPLSQH
jgi:hypothetical protein